MRGINGKILTTTDARGIELSELGESRVEPVPGYDLHLSLDKNIQMYAQQAAEKVMGTETGRCCFYFAVKSSKRRNLCQCKCAGI